jgi:hypothetical protein
MSSNDTITIVSGLPRSGTSMMMSMLEAGGLTALTDGVRAADEDNPKGYYEFERVKKIKQDTAWLADARGKVVKMISQLLLDLPAANQYRIIFMRRNIDEVLASQKQMMVRRGTVKEGGPSDKEMGDMLLKHVDHVMHWMDKQPNIKYVTVSYNEMVKDAKDSITKINQLLGGTLNASAMATVVDQALYRQRK